MYASDNQEHWLNEIKRSDWNAGQFLYELLRDNRLKELCGESTKVLLLTDGDALVSFCTYAEQDDIRDTELTPWVGFIYTFQEYRGKRHMGKLLNRAYEMAKDDGHKHIYISTGETGLYEKYGYSFWKKMEDMHGEDSRVYRISVGGRIKFGETAEEAVIREVLEETGAQMQIVEDMNKTDEEK